MNNQYNIYQLQRHFDDQINDLYSSASSSSEEVLDLKYIITNKPSTNDVREFLRANLTCIKSPISEMFESSSE